MIWMPISVVVLAFIIGYAVIARDAILEECPEKSEHERLRNKAPLNERSIGVCILLSIITFGIYGIYWLYLLVKNTHSIQKNTTSCTGEMLCLIFVPFYSIYWWYTRGEKVKQRFAEHNYNALGSGMSYLVLAILRLDVVCMAIMQNDFNSLKSETY